MRKKFIPLELMREVSEVGYNNKEYILISPKGQVWHHKNPITLVMLSDPPLINVLHETPKEENETNSWPKANESSIPARSRRKQT